MAQVTENPEPEKKILNESRPVIEVADARGGIVEQPKAPLSSGEGIAAGQFIIRDVGQPSPELIEAPETKVTNASEPEEILNKTEPDVIEIAEDTRQGIIKEPTAQFSSVEDIAGEYIIRDLGEPGTELIDVPEMTMAEKAPEESGPSVIEIAKDTPQENSGEKTVVSYLQEIIGVPISPESAELTEFSGISETKPEEMADEVKPEVVQEPQKDVVEDSETVVVADEAKSEKSVQTFVETIRKSNFLKDLLGLNQRYLGFVSPKTRRSSDHLPERSEEKVQ